MSRKQGNKHIIYSYIYICKPQILSLFIVIGGEVAYIYMYIYMYIYIWEFTPSIGLRSFLWVWVKYQEAMDTKDWFWFVVKNLLNGGQRN